jgi:hypothetical protein
MEARERALNVDIFDEEGFAEAVVFLEVQLWVTGFTEPGCPHLYPERKTVHFRGRSVGGEDNESNLRGRVKMTPEGEVHWELVFHVWPLLCLVETDGETAKISIYDGEERWLSQGIQVGGPGTAMGLIGNWTGVHHSASWLFSARGSVADSVA